MSDELGTLHIPARDIPVPASVSEAAQTMLRAPRRMVPPYPPVEDLEAWRKLGVAINQAILPMLQATAVHVAAQVRDSDRNGVRVYEVQRDDIADDDRRTVLDIHGGAYFVGYGDVCRAEAIGLAGSLRRRICSVDYRSPPDHPYPAPLDDCLAVYRSLLETCGAHNIIVSGASAGANLGAALVLRARDEGLALPRGVILNTPHLDMTNGSDTLYTNRGLDSALSGSDLVAIRSIYAPGQDYRDPYVSPLFADLTKGFVPTFLCTGTRDLFLSDTVRMHAALRAANIPAELHVTEAASHGNFHGAPEEKHIDREMRKFIDSLWNV